MIGQEATGTSSKRQSNMLEKKLITRVLKHWNTLHGGAVESPSLIFVS